MLVDRSLRELLAAFGSPDPTPGGGSAAALGAAIGASLLLMVAALPKTRRGSDEDKAALALSVTALGTLREALTDAIDSDTTAYQLVVASYRLPKASVEEQAARKAAIQMALRLATDVPLTVMRLSALALVEAEHVAAHGHRAAASDVGVAIALLRAGLEGARLNVEINIGNLADAEYVSTVKEDIGRWRARGTQAAKAADLHLATANGGSTPS
jgi:formiminotetrahydrofolate cyclodeaminase